MRSHPRSPLLRKPRDGLDCYTRFFFLFFLTEVGLGNFSDEKQRGPIAKKTPNTAKKGPLGVIVVFTEVCGCKTSKLPTFVILLCLFSSSLLLYLDRNHERKTCMRDPLGFDQFAFRVKGRRRHVLRVTLGGTGLCRRLLWTRVGYPARKPGIQRVATENNQSIEVFSSVGGRLCFCLIYIKSDFWLFQHSSSEKGGTPTSGSN